MAFMVPTVEARAYLRATTVHSRRLVVMSDFDNRAKTWDTQQKLDRAKSIAACMRDNLDFSDVQIALEYGCGTGLLSFELSDDLPRVVLADSSPGMLEVANTKIAETGAAHFRTELLDLTTTSPSEQSYDLIYTLLTLHHIPDTQPILRTFHEMLNSGGTLVIVDLDAEDGSFHGPHIDVHHGFDRNALKQMLLEVGFNRVNITNCYQLTRECRNYSLFLAGAQK